MKKSAILVVLVLSIAGCDHFEKQKVENQRQWHQSRARIICGVGLEHLKAGDFDKALSCATESISLDQEYIPARMLLAKGLLGKGRYSDAAGHLRKIESSVGMSEAEATGAPESVNAKAEISYLLGEALEGTGRYAEALRCYQKARTLNPSDDTYVTASAEVLVRMGRPKAALELLEVRLSRTGGVRAPGFPKPDAPGLTTVVPDGEIMRPESFPSPSIILLAGEVAMLAGAYDRATEFFQQCLDVKPKDTSVREGLAKAQFFAANYKNCLKTLKILVATGQGDLKSTVVASSAGGRNSQSSWMYLMMGDCYMALDRPREARIVYETAANIEPDDWQVWVSLAKSAVALGQTRRGILAGRRALHLNSESVEAAVILACAMLIEGRPDDAMKILTVPARKHPDDPMLWCMLGKCYSARGFPRQASACYMSALRSDPNHSLAKSLLGGARQSRDAGTEKNRVAGTERDRDAGAEQDRDAAPTAKAESGTRED